MRHFQFMAAALMLCTNVMAQQSFTVSITNPSRQARTDAPVVIPLAPYGHVSSALVTIGGQEIPSQLDDLNKDGVNDELVFTTDMGTKETRQAHITLYNTGKPRTYQPRTFAEIVMRNNSIQEKNKHNIYLSGIRVEKATGNTYTLLHHHGVAFESELVALRVYFDQRQTIDLYGKYHKRLEIEQTQFYPSQEQKANGYGDDILWVGNTFGLGAMRGWNGTEPTMIADVENRCQRVLAKGPVRTIVEVEDNQWTIDPAKEPVNMTIRYTLYAGHRDIAVDVRFSRPVADFNFSTGIINVKNSTEFTDHAGLRGCWGRDWPGGKPQDGLKEETVGLGICIPGQFIRSEQAANKDNYGYVIHTATDQLHYAIAFNSDDENFGMHSEKDWYAWLKNWKQELQNPIVVK